MVQQQEQQEEPMCNVWRLRFMRNLLREAGAIYCASLVHFWHPCCCISAAFMVCLGTCMPRLSNDVWHRLAAVTVK